MAQQPHDMSGKTCRCGRELTKQSFTGTIPKRVNGFIIHEKACSVCMNEHYSKGE